MMNRKFTPEQAEKTLPLVRLIVRDILENGRKLKRYREPDSDNLPDVIVLRENLQRLLKELETIGCVFKDWNFEKGLVDFPSEIYNESVLLCWRSDEEHIVSYHSYTGSYASRKPIPQELLTHLPAGTEI